MDNEELKKLPQLFSPRTSKIILYFIVSASVIFFLLGSFRLINIFPNRDAKSDRNYLELVADIAAKTRSYYIDEVVPGEKFPAAYTGLLGTLDKVSCYLDSRSSMVFEAYSKDTACSTGLFIARARSYFRVTGVIEDSPADRAGLKRGMLIKSVGGKNLFLFPFFQAYMRLLSVQPGDLSLIVQEPGAGATRQIVLRTEHVKIVNKVSELPGDILLVEIPKFDHQGVAYLAEVLRLKQAEKGNLRMIIDLRRYSGGDFHSFLELSGLFFKHHGMKSVESKKVATPAVLSLIKKEGQEDFSIGSETPLEYEAVVVVDRSTIMYAELLTALFKCCKPGNGEQEEDDSKKVIAVIGSKTPGIVSLFRQHSFDDSSSILLSEGFFSIKGEKISDAGVKPDIVLGSIEDFDRVIEKSREILDNGKI